MALSICFLLFIATTFFQPKGALPTQHASAALITHESQPLPMPPLLFWLVWTKTADDWSWLFNGVITALLKHHPRASVRVLATRLPLDFFACYAAEGFNISVQRYDFEELARGTPAEPLAASGKVQGSRFRVAHESDVVRLLLLQKHGGTYIDTDLLFLRPLDYDIVARSGAGLETSLVGETQTWGARWHDARARRINNAIIHMARAHDPFINCMVGELWARYDPNEWACIGPDLTAVCYDRLNATAAAAPGDTGDAGAALTPQLYPREFFYPLDWRFAWYANRRRQERLEMYWEKGERWMTYAYHLYNSHSHLQLEDHRPGGGYERTGGPQPGSWLAEVLATLDTPAACRLLEKSTGPIVPAVPKRGDEKFDDGDLYPA